MGTSLRQCVGILVLWFVVMHEGAGCGVNVQSGIGAADVGDVRELLLLLSAALMLRKQAALTILVTSLELLLLLSVSVLMVLT